MNLLKMSIVGVLGLVLVRQQYKEMTTRSCFVMHNIYIEYRSYVISFIRLMEEKRADAATNLIRIQQIQISYYLLFSSIKFIAEDPFELSFE